VYVDEHGKEALHNMKRSEKLNQQTRSRMTKNRP